MKIPPLFLEQMQRLLGAEYPDYLAALTECSPQKGLRVNTLKLSLNEFEQIFPYAGKCTPFCESGLVLTDPLRKYGLHPYHHAGLYYLQDPSAMCAVSALAPFVVREDKVLDLCAAPGGKSTQLAAAMSGRGILVCNEFVFHRARILQGNLERMGVTNAMVTCNSPKDFAALLPEYFDAVLVDAPCSGEGMFRKEDAAVQDWNPKNVETCAARQLEILRSAAACLVPGGYLLYSTCTLNDTENESVVQAFLSEQPFELAQISPALSVACRPGFGKIDKAIRIFPHLAAGEGHFACLLRKKGDIAVSYDTELPFEPASKRDRQELTALLGELAAIPATKEVRAYRDKLYLLPQGLPFRKGLNVLQAGVTAAERVNGRILPHHAFALALKRGEAVNHVSYPCQSPEIAKYLAGETVDCAPGFSGWGVLEADGYPLGLVKAVNGTLKNHYPKGLRGRV